MGRKDPFPGAKGAVANGKLTAGGESWGSYDTETTEQLYGNDGETAILMTANDAVDAGNIDDYLFRSVSGLTMKDNSTFRDDIYVLLHEVYGRSRPPRWHRKVSFSD